jgi:hypothetical protein
MTITDPELAEWIAHRIRMSAVLRVSSMRRITGKETLTKVGYWNDV